MEYQLIKTLLIPLIFFSLIMISCSTSELNEEIISPETLLFNWKETERTNQKRKGFMIKFNEDGTGIQKILALDDIIEEQNFTYSISKATKSNETSYYSVDVIIEKKYSEIANEKNKKNMNITIYDNQATFTIVDSDNNSEAITAEKSILTDPQINDELTINFQHASSQLMSLKIKGDYQEIDESFQSENKYFHARHQNINNNIIQQLFSWKTNEWNSPAANIINNFINNRIEAKPKEIILEQGQITINNTTSIIYVDSTSELDTSDETNIQSLNNNEIFRTKSWVRTACANNKIPPLCIQIHNFNPSMNNTEYRKDRFKLIEDIFRESSY